MELDKVYRWPNYLYSRLEYVFWKIDSNGLGININVKKMNRMQYPNNITLIGKGDVQIVLNKLQEARGMGLKINRNQIK